MEIVKKEQANGGEGAIFIKHILNETELNGKCKMFAEVTIPAGCSLGYHVHHNESETYYIVKGEGEYNDNGTTRTVRPGRGPSRRMAAAMGSPTAQTRIWYLWLLLFWTRKSGDKPGSRIGNARHPEEGGAPLWTGHSLIPEYIRRF